MFSIIGIVVVFASIVAGYLMEKGNLAVLVQPAELVIIGGAAIGTILVGNPLPLAIKVFKSVLGLLSGSKFNKDFYLETLKLLSDIFTFARKSGTAKLEEDVEHPEKSAAVLEISEARSRITTSCTSSATPCGRRYPASLRPTISMRLLENDIDTHHHEIAAPGACFGDGCGRSARARNCGGGAWSRHTMGALGGPPEEIGHKVAAALVGTFLGILLSYGVVSPIAASLDKINDAESQYYQALRAGLWLCQRHGAHDRGRVRPPCGPAGDFAPRFKRWKLPAKVEPAGDAARRRKRRGSEHCERKSSTNHNHQRVKKPATAATMAAPGRWPTRILLRP